jgi:hypothetical protein
MPKKVKKEKEQWKGDDEVETKLAKGISKLSTEDDDNEAGSKTKKKEKKKKD